jgi:hypothetical protein
MQPEIGALFNELFFYKIDNFYLASLLCQLAQLADPPTPSG